MVVKRKAIFKKAVARNLQAKKYENAKKRLTETFRGIPKRPGGDGMIHLDPREWGGNGGFVDGPQIYDDMIRLDPREWGENGGFEQYRGALKKQMPMPGGPGGSLIKSPGFPTPGRGDGTIRLDPREWNGFNNSMNHGKELFDRELQNQYVPGEVRGQGQEVGEMQQSPHDMFQRKPVELEQRRSLQGFRGQPPTRGGGGVGSGNPSLPPISALPQKPMPMPGVRPPGSGGGMIHLDPREWGGNGGFDGVQKQKPMPMPGVPRPPMSGGQKPMPMPQLPNPGIMKQMPMPNPRRNLIPRPIDPRYKMM